MAQSGIVPVRYPEADLELVKAARAIMGQSVSQFTRSASVALARAVLEAAADAGIGPGEGSWDRSWIVDPTLQLKPDGAP